jgi:hypothetical protein
MKKTVLLLSFFAALITGFASPSFAAADLPNQAAFKQEQVNTVKVEEHGNFYKMGRGFMNIGTCWMEVFRCMVYRNSEVPFWGFIAGSIEGTGLTAMRAFGGVTDVLFLGFGFDGLYGGQFKDFVWQSPWVPKEEKK